jgi:predicted nucleic acid-binding protein
VTFVDTNVLVYSTAVGAPLRDRARAALARLWGAEQLSLSRQVLREYVAVVTRPQLWGRPLSFGEAVMDTDVFVRRFRVLEDGPAVWDNLVALGRRHAFGGRQVHDANLVATMLAHRERRLLTFNEPDFRRFAALIELLIP